MKYKRQHYVPASYLSAWCDPNSPSEHTPYVWLFSKDSKQVRKKPPEKIFFEKDLYTLYHDDGQRDLKIEYTLSRLEDEFTKLRRQKLAKHLLLSPKEHWILCMFVAAMYGRTKASGEHLSNQWKQVLELGEEMQRWIEEASPEDKANMMSAFSAPLKKEKGITLEKVRELVERPLPSSLPAIIRAILPILLKIPFLILEVIDPFEFITSDAPCVWYDPADYEQPRPFGAGGLISPTIEITLPLSPSQMLFFGKKLNVSGIYVPLKDKQFIDELNQRTKAWAHEYFVANKPAVKPV